MEGCATWQRGGGQRALFAEALFAEALFAEELAKGAPVGRRGCLLTCLFALKRELFSFGCSSKSSLEVGVMTASLMRAPL